MGSIASKPGTAEITRDDVEDTISLALAVAMSVEQTPPAQDASTYLRVCSSCGKISYLRQTICLNPYCSLSYLRMTPSQVGELLQSWGPSGTDSKASADQLEKARLKRTRDPSEEKHEKEWTWSKPRGKKRRTWISSIKQGVHPRTGQKLEKEVLWKGKLWTWKDGVGWEEVPTEPPAPTPSGPPPATPESIANYREAQRLQELRLKEQAERHRAEANIGLPTSAKPPGAPEPKVPPPAAVPEPKDPPPAVPEPKNPPTAAKTAVPKADAKSVMDLYRTASPEAKAKAYEAMQRALAPVPGPLPPPPLPPGGFGMMPSPRVPLPKVPVKAMPELQPELLALGVMANQIRGMLMSAFMAMGTGGPRGVPITVYPPKTKPMPAVLMPPGPMPPMAPVAPVAPKAAVHVPGDTTDEEMGESPTMDDP